MRARQRQDENTLSIRRDTASSGLRKTALATKTTSVITIRKPHVSEPAVQKALPTKPRNSVNRRTALASLTDNTPQTSRTLQPKTVKSLQSKTKLGPVTPSLKHRTQAPKSLKKNLQVYTPAGPKALRPPKREETNYEVEYTAPTAEEQPYQPPTPFKRHLDDDLLALDRDPPEPELNLDNGMFSSRFELESRDSPSRTYTSSDLKFEEGPMIDDFDLTF